MRDSLDLPAPPALLLIAHGTREPRGAQEMDELVALLQSRIPAAVAHAWLEDFAEPRADEAAAHLVSQGARRIVTVPFLNFGAGHAKTDVPGQIALAHRAHPEVEFLHGRVLGLHPALFALARARIDAVSDPGQRGEEVLVVAASGSSDPDANADVAKAARFLSETTGHRWAEIAFAGVTWPRIEEVLERIAGAGARRAALFSWSLLAGLLEQHVSEAAEKISVSRGLAIADAGRFGPDTLVADAVLDRYREAIDGDIRMNCDLCAYRVPLPGRENWVAAPSAGGTGERVGQ